VVLLRLRDALTASEPQASTDPAFAASGVVIDGDFLAVYERQGSGLLQMNPRQTNQSGDPFPPSPVWAGFAYGPDNGAPITSVCANPPFDCTPGQSIDDWFVQAGVFRTMLQFICPNSFENNSELDDDMDDLAQWGGGTNFAFGFFAFGFTVINTYTAAEVHIRSRHDAPCYCNTDTDYFAGFRFDNGDDVDYTVWDAILVDMAAAVVGTIHLGGPEGALIGWRTVSVAGALWWDGRLRTNPVFGEPVSEDD